MAEILAKRESCESVTGSEPVFEITKTKYAAVWPFVLQGRDKVSKG